MPLIQNVKTVGKKFVSKEVIKDLEVRMMYFMYLRKLAAKRQSMRRFGPVGDKV